MEPRNGDYEFYHFDTADDLIRAIAPVPALKTGTTNSKFIFRGQRDASWKLIPSAFRRKQKNQTVSDAIALVAPSFPDSPDHQVWAEFQLLSAFVETCDRAVIALPEDGYKFRKQWMNDQRQPVESAYRFPEKWPWDEHLSLLAFAQHHGVPTRLLDWTWSPLVAAYFAAAELDHFKNNDFNGELAIWAFDTESINKYPQIRLVPMPGANSVRLGAQRGIFTLITAEGQRGMHVDHEQMNLADLLYSRVESRVMQRPLWKLTLSHTEALRLLYLCHLNGVDAASVFPGPEGAGKATLERAMWQRNRSDGHSAVSIRPVGLQEIESQRSRLA